MKTIEKLYVLNSADFGSDFLWKHFESCVISNHKITVNQVKYSIKFQRFPPQCSSSMRERLNKLTDDNRNQVIYNTVRCKCSTRILDKIVLSCVAEISFNNFKGIRHWQAAITAVGIGDDSGTQVCDIFACSKKWLHHVTFLGLLIVADNFRVFMLTANVAEWVTQREKKEHEEFTSVHHSDLNYCTCWAFTIAENVHRKRNIFLDLFLTEKEGKLIRNQICLPNCFF